MMVLPGTILFRFRGVDEYIATYCLSRGVVRVDYMLCLLVSTFACFFLHFGIPLGIVCTVL